MTQDIRQLQKERYAISTANLGAVPGKYSISRYGITIFGGYELFHIADRQGKELCRVISSREEADELVQLLNGGERTVMTQLPEELPLAQAKAPEEKYADVDEAEAFQLDLLRLVKVVRAVLARQERTADMTTERELRDALEQLEPWLEYHDNDPRSMGWVNDKGLP